MRTTLSGVYHYTVTGTIYIQMPIGLWGQAGRCIHGSLAPGHSKSNHWEALV